jgi:LPS O-antigen subunit length determinant protein (WzzB/FepE family)
MSNPTQPNHLKTSDDEYLVDLSKLWQTIRQSWRLITGLTFVGVAIALVVALMLPKEWEASATLQIGRMHQITGEWRAIEDPQQAVERLKLREFKENVLASLALPLDEDEDDRSEIYFKSVKGVAVKGTDFITVSTRGFSTQEANASLDATMNQLMAKHVSIAEPMKQRLTAEMTETHAKLVASEEVLKQLNTQLLASGTYKAGSEFAPSIVAFGLLASKTAEVNALKSKEIELTAVLATLNEQITKPVNKIQVSKTPIFPKKSIFLVLGLFLGLMVGVAFALVRAARKERAAI